MTGGSVEPDSDDSSMESEAPATDTSTPSDNPFDDVGVVLSMPKTIEIEMVDVRSLGDYEVWFSITSLLLSTFVGFLVAFIQAKDPNPDTATADLLGIITLIFGAMFLASAALTASKRHAMTKDRERIEFRAGRKI